MKKFLFAILILLLLLLLFFLFQRKEKKGGGHQNRTVVSQNPKKAQRAQKPKSEKPLVSTASKKYPYFKEIDEQLRKRQFQFAACFLKDKTSTLQRVQLQLFWDASGTFQKLELDPSPKPSVLQCIETEAQSWTWVKPHPGGNPFSYQIQLILF